MSEASRAEVPAPVPDATYRLQLAPGFGFDEAAAIFGYLVDLGISHVYCSPYLQAVRGSRHGYDIVDPSRVNEELGGEAGHARMVAGLRQHGLGQVVDIVPNHMAIGDPRNLWWWSVLEHGPSSPYAAYFDVDWSPAEAKLRDRVLLPVLGDHYGAVLSAGDLGLERDGSTFTVTYFEHRFPVSPQSLDAIVVPAAEVCGSDELRFIGEQLGSLPLATATDVEEIERRQRSSRVLLALLGRLLAEDGRARDAVEAETEAIAADEGRLHDLLERQRLPVGAVAHRLRGAGLSALLRRHHACRGAHRGPAGLRRHPRPSPGLVRGRERAGAAGGPP